MFTYWRAFHLEGKCITLVQALWNLPLWYVKSTWDKGFISIALGRKTHKLFKHIWTLFVSVIFVSKAYWFSSFHFLQNIIFLLHARIIILFFPLAMVKCFWVRCRGKLYLFAFVNNKQHEKYRSIFRQTQQLRVLGSKIPQVGAEGQIIDFCQQWDQTSTTQYSHSIRHSFVRKVLFSCWAQLSDC